MSKPLTICIFIITCFLFDCKNAKEEYVILDGLAQGGTYHISYLPRNGVNYRPQIDSLFAAVDTSVSIYKANSIISAINNNDSNARVNEHFTAVFNKAMEVSRPEGVYSLQLASPDDGESGRLPGQMYRPRGRLRRTARRCAQRASRMPGISSTCAV